MTKPQVAAFLLCSLISSTTIFGQSSTSEVIEDLRASEPWTKEPDAFRSVPFGSTESEISATLGRLKCRDYKEWGEAGFPQRRCSIADKAKRLKIGESMMDEAFILHQGRLVSIELHEDAPIWSAPSPAPNFSAVRDAFTERYGTPTRQQTIREKGVRQVTIDKYVGGRKAGNRIDYVPYEYRRMLLTWEGERVIVELGGNLDSDDFFAASLETQEWRKILADTEAAKKKKASATEF